jgi:SNF2 family DNA or RNA helicase
VKTASIAKAARPGTGKLGSLMEMLEELLSEGRRILLFSQFTSMLALIEQELRQRNLDYSILTGETTDRRTPVKDFQSGKTLLFLISLKAGGTGLNLTAADTVIHYDPWWNPAVENQATDRAYRIGQDKPVFVYKLIARGTVEEKIQALQQEKAALAAGVLEGGMSGGWKLEQSDIEALFAPLRG